MPSFDANKFVEPIFIQKVRDLFIEENQLNYDLYDDCDVKKVLQCDWTVRRYLIACDSNVEKAFIMLRDSMRWRKQYGVNARSDDSFPIEFYKLGAFFPYNRDKEGNITIFLRIKFYKKWPRISDYIKELFVHVINKIDAQTEGTGLRQR